MKQKPQKQGVQDGACGFYAIGNSISILIPKEPVDEIFKIIFKYYLENENGEHFIEGMYRNKLNSILNQLSDKNHQKLVEKAYDLIRSSQVKSSNNVQVLEQEVFNQIRILEELIKNKRYDEIEESVNKVCHSAEERNRKLKLLN